MFNGLKIRENEFFMNGDICEFEGIKYALMDQAEQDEQGNKIFRAVDEQGKAYFITLGIVDARPLTEEP